MDGTLASQGYPAGGGLRAETVYHGYDNLGSPSSTASSLSDYVEQSFYAPDAQPAEFDLGTATSAKWSRMLYSYDPATARLTETRIQEEAASWANATDTSYSYSNAGNVTKISESVASDTQCLKYNYAQRLTAAWAQTATACPATPPGASGIGGPAPYQQKLTYDSGGAGNITDNTLLTPGTTTDTALTYPAPGSPQPHAATSATTTINGTATTSGSTYTPAGQLHTTGTGAPAQTLTWNTAGKLVLASDGGGDSTAYRYDAAGNLLVRQDNGTSTLYLPGEELSDNGPTVTATRYYTHAGQTVAARTPAGVSWLLSDPHGTDDVAIDTTSNNPATNLTQRYYTPFGAPRGAAPGSWPGDHGFAGGTTDTLTGLTNLGAREYNPATTVFLSPDPLLAPYTPQDLNPYTYAADNPATHADPTGLCPQFPGCNGVPQPGPPGHRHPSQPYIPSGQPGGQPCQPAPGAGQLPSNPCIQHPTLCMNLPVQLNELALQGPGNARTWNRLPGVCDAGLMLLSCPSLATTGNSGQGTQEGRTALYLGMGRGALDLLLRMIAQALNGINTGPGEWGVVNDSMSLRAALYQEQISGQDIGLAYKIHDVEFDGYANGTLQEAKSFYGQFTKNGEFEDWWVNSKSGGQKMLLQARSQLAAAQGTPITWSVAEQPAADAIENLFANNGITGISVAYMPPAG